MSRAVLFLALVLAPSLHAAVPLPPENERWTKLPVDNIVIYSDARDGVTREVAENIGRLRLALAHVSGLEVHSAVPVNLYVFRDETAFAPYREAMTGSTKEEIRGVFIPRPRAGYAIMIAGQGMVDHVVAHEMIHAFIRNTVVGVPPWLDEGLAEFYASLTPVADAVRLGSLRQDYIDELSNHGMMPLRELFTFRPDAHRADDPHVLRFYAESWLFAHYLLIGQPARGRLLGDFLARLDQGTKLGDAFEQAFHAKMSDVDVDLGAYLHRSRFPFVQYSRREVGEPKVGEPKPIARKDALIALADLLLVTNAWEDSGPFLKKALEIDPNDPAALALLGRMKEGEDHLAEAIALYDRAVSIDSDDVRPFAFASNSLVSRLQEQQRDGVAPSKRDVEKIRQIASLGLSRVPNDPDLLGTMGASFTFSGEDAKSGIAWSAKAFLLAPSRTDIASDLVLLYTRAGRPDLAKTMIDRVIAPSGNEKMINEADENIVLADFETAEDLMRSGKAAEAKALLEKVKTSAKNPKLRAAAEERLRQSAAVPGR